MQPNFEILKISNPVIVEYIRSSVSSEVCEFNKADIFHLSDGRYLVMPKLIGKYVLIYNNRQLLNEHIAKKYFPINDFEINETLEKEKMYLENIDKYIFRYIEHVHLNLK